MRPKRRNARPPGAISTPSPSTYQPRRKENGERTASRGRPPAADAAARTVTGSKTCQSPFPRRQATPPVSVEPKIWRGARPNTASARSDTSFVSNAPLVVISTQFRGTSY